jgi:HEAT repeat protein
VFNAIRVSWNLKRLEAGLPLRKYDARYRHRTDAAYALGRLGDPRATGPLVRALGDPSEWVRKAAAWALEQLGEPTFHSIVLGDVEDFRRLGYSQDPRVFESLMRAFDNCGADGRVEAASGMAALGDGRAVGPLIRALDDTANEVRIAAARALGRCGDVAGVDPLAKAIGDPDRGVREAAASALGALGSPRAVEALAHALADEWYTVRAAAADALGRTRDGGAVEPLVRALADDLVVTSAADALGDLGDRRAIVPLLFVLGSSLDYHREVAARALAKLGEPSFQPMVRRDNQDFVRLGESRDPRLFEPLLRAFASENQEVCVAAASGLACLGDVRAIEALTRALANASSGIRKGAAEALRQIGEPKWTEIVRGEDADFERLGSCGDSRAEDLLVQALRAGPSVVRQAAAKGLESLGWQPRDDSARAFQAIAWRHWERLPGLGPAAVQPLVDALEANDPLLTPGALTCLATLGVQWLDVLAEVKEPARKLVVEALGDLGDERLVEPLTSVLGTDSESKETRAAAASALGRIGGPEAARALGDALHHAIGSDPIKVGLSPTRAIVRALGNLGDPAAVTTLVDALGNVYTAQDAIEALLEIHGKSAHAVEAHHLKWISALNGTNLQSADWELYSVKPEIGLRTRPSLSTYQETRLYKLQSLAREELVRRGINLR